MTPCTLHEGLSTAICGCAPVDRVQTTRPDVHRDFSALAIGTKVRFARALREVEGCNACGLPGVPIRDPGPRNWPLPSGKKLRATRVAMVHDATVGETGYVVGAQCTWLEQTGKKR